jgi:hypothetical protein
MIVALAIALAAAWLALACVFAGVGSLVLGRRTDLDDGWPAAHAAFWVGVAVVTSGALVWHLVLPVDWRASLLVAALACTGWLVHRRMFVACARRWPSWPLTLGCAGVWVWVANHALDSAAIDDFLYEFQAVRWDHDFHIVPGLANLHGRLGFNQSHHLLGALLSIGPLAGRVNHVIGGLFVVVVATYLLSGLVDLWRQGRSASSSTRMKALLVGPVTGLALFSYYGSTISTLKADVIVTACVILIACLVVEFAEAPGESGRAQRAFLALAATTAFLGSVKLSAVVFAAVVAAGTGGAGLLAALRRRLPLARPAWMGLGLLLTTATIVPVRSIVLSGYPAYPAAVLGVDVDWRVPAAQADAERAIITSWARLQPTYDVGRLDSWDWIPGWGHDVLRSEEFTIVLPLTLAILCIAGALVHPGSSGRPLARPGRTLSLRWAYGTNLMASTAGLVVWWLGAPAGRFAVGLFWVLTATLLTWSLDVGVWSRPWGTRIALVSAGLGVIALSFGVTGLAPGYVGLTLLLAGVTGWMIMFARTASGRGVSLAVLCAVLALAEGSARVASFVAHGRLADAKAVLWLTPDYYMEYRAGYPVEPRRTRSGLTVYITSSTDYDTPLPNTRYFNPYLELRRPGDLSSGFRSRVPPDVANYGYSLDSGRRAPRTASR